MNMPLPHIVHISEPRLTFGHGQSCEHPKDGLFLFGPFDNHHCKGQLRYGVIATDAGHKRFDRWIAAIRGYIAPQSDAAHLMSWPGFHAAFGVQWPVQPHVRLTVSGEALSEAICRENRYEAVHEAVSIFESRIRQQIKSEDERPDVWFVVIPEEVYVLGRPDSKVPKANRSGSHVTVTKKHAHQAAARAQGFLFEDDQRAATLYEYEVNFHNQLKARLLDVGAVIQIIRETTITPDDFVNSLGKPKRRVDDPSAIAWNLCTTTFFKAQGKPWRLEQVRPGVCYVGIVYKQLHTPTPQGNACCGAQMFLDSGDGVVFKGAIGPWYSEASRECHLTRGKAAELMRLVGAEYKLKHGCPPSELFIHAPTYFNTEEWDGFASAAPEQTKLAGIRIRRDRQFKLYRAEGKTPILRGTALIQNERRAYLWTLGYVPRLETYPGWEVPSPLEVAISQGEADIYQVCADILALTKLNLNACIYGDGIPVTLRFADAVGEILTAAPTREQSRALSFRHYI